MTGDVDTALLTPEFGLVKTIEKKTHCNVLILYIERDTRKTDHNQNNEWVPLLTLVRNHLIIHMYYYNMAINTSFCNFPM